MGNFLYNKEYLKAYKEYRDIMNTEIVVVLSKIGGQTEDPIFKMYALPKSRVFIDEDGREINASSVILFKDELVDIRSDNGGDVFPINDIQNRIKIVRINNFSYNLDSKHINFFDNILRLDLVSTT